MGWGGAVSRLTAAERKAQLLGVAARVFARRGYAGTTTAELAESAGVSEPIIYRHFRSKKELFVELVRQTGAETVASWERSLEGLSDPVERLAKLIRSNPMVSPRGYARYRVIVQALAEAEDAEIHGALAEHVGALKGVIEREVRGAQEAGVVSRRFSPELTAWTLIYVGVGHGTTAALRLPGVGVDARGNDVGDIIGLVMLGERYRQKVDEQARRLGPPVGGGG